MHVSFEWENFKQIEAWKSWHKPLEAFHLTWNSRRCRQTLSCFQFLPITSIVRSNRLVRSRPFVLLPFRWRAGCSPSIHWLHTLRAVPSSEKNDANPDLRVRV